MKCPICGTDHLAENKLPSVFDLYFDIKTLPKLAEEYRGARMRVIDMEMLCESHGINHDLLYQYEEKEDESKDNTGR
jgi:hypothetical protein